MSQFKIKAKVRFGGAVSTLSVEIKDFGPFNSYLSAYSLVQENGWECFTI